MRAKFINEIEIQDRLYLGDQKDFKNELKELLTKKGFTFNYASEISDNLWRSLSASRRPKEEVLEDLYNLGNILVNFVNNKKRFYA